MDEITPSRAGVVPSRPGARSSADGAARSMAGIASSRAGAAPSVAGAAVSVPGKGLGHRGRASAVPGSPDLHPAVTLAAVSEWEQAMARMAVGRRGIGRFIAGAIVLGLLGATGVLAQDRADSPGEAMEPQGGALAGERLRILISSDIGGSDDDDFQSMIHLLMYADLFDIEGLVSSPPHKGRKSDILKVIDAYAEDYPALLAHSAHYPAPGALREMTRQGATDPAPAAGFAEATEGSEWIARQALRDDPRPLYVLVWGSITDVAQALHDHPAIKPKLRVHFIASWNRKMDPHAFDYIEQHHADTWLIQDETTFRGWFVGGRQEEELGNVSFPKAHVIGRGAMGRMFGTLKAAGAEAGGIKMGDTPTVARLLRGMPADPTQPSWGGQFRRIADRPHWWTDQPDPELKEGNFAGARTVNRWRADYLRDWQQRMQRLE